MIYVLPQHDSPQSDIRKNELEKEREKYNFDFNKFNYVTPNPEYPMVEKVPFEDNSLTKLEWAVDVVSILLRSLANQSLFDSEIKRGSLCKFVLYFRLNRLLSDSQSAGFIERLYKGILAVLQALMRLFGQTPKSEDIKYDVENKKINQVEKRIKSMVKDVKKNALNRKQNLFSFNDYNNLFQIIYLPCIAEHILEDRDFAAQRVAGANPLVIQRFTKEKMNFPIKEEHFQRTMGEDDSLAQALKEGRLYIADYKILEDIVLDPNDQKYLCSPIALFALKAGNCPNRKLITVAIQCDQEHSDENPILIPPKLNSLETERWAWQFAKLMVQIADGNYHELISHLGRTHLFVEPIVIATHRQLASRHPLKALLLPHFEGTLFINDAAVKGLINEGGIIEKVLAGKLDLSLKLSIKAAKGFPFSFNDSFLPKTFESRGVEDSQVFPDYPYRDDSLLIWDAIYSWVSSYLRFYYRENNITIHEYDDNLQKYYDNIQKYDENVQKDFEVQAWLSELISENGGRMSGIGETDIHSSTPQIKTLDYLIEATTLIIFTCSVQHAAVNFTQSSLMTYMPNMPLAAYKTADNTRQSIKNLNQVDYFSVLPSQSQSEIQMNIAYLLGSVYYTTLGSYDRESFRDAKIIEYLENFKSKLINIENIINQKNESRPTYYNVLKPSKIPQSLNI